MKNFLLAAAFLMLQTHAHAQWVEDYESLTGTSTGTSTAKQPSMNVQKQLLPPPSHLAPPALGQPKKSLRMPTTDAEAAAQNGQPTPVFQEGFLVEEVPTVQFGTPPVQNPNGSTENLVEGLFEQPYQLSDDADELMEQVEQHLDDGEVVKAISVLNHLVKLHPENAKGLERLGDAYMENYQYQQAIETYDALVTLTQDYHSLMKKGFAHNKQGQVQMVHQILSEIRRECGFWCDEYKQLKRAVTRRDNYRNRIHDRDDNQDRFGRGYDNFDRYDESY